jgi:outer membrane receptor for ferrienterochelin and colicin
MTLSFRSDVTSYGITLRSIPGQNVQDRYINRKISDLNEFDVNGSYKFNKDMQLAAGIKNLFESEQPADIGGGAGGSNEVNDALYDINGRKFFITYSQKF